MQGASNSLYTEDSSEHSSEHSEETDKEEKEEETRLSIDDRHCEYNRSDGGPSSDGEDRESNYSQHQEDASDLSV